MSILPPPPHPRSWRPPPPPQPLYQTLAQARQESREELPQDDLEVDRSSATASNQLYDFAEDDLATAPYHADFPPADMPDYRRSNPVIPPALANYSSWPPTVLEARDTMLRGASSFGSSARAAWQQFAERVKIGSERAAWQARWLSRRGKAWLLERWAQVDESQKGWMRAKAPYAVGLLVVATSMFAIGRTFEPSPEGEGDADSGDANSGTVVSSSVLAGRSSPDSPASAKPAASTPGQRPPNVPAEGSGDGAERRAAQAPSALSLPPMPGVSPSPDNEAPILVGLAENLISAGRDAEAVPVLERALARNPDLTDDPAFLRAVKRAALSEDRTAAVQAYALLTGPMGERGAEMLYEISVSPAARRGVRERAAYYVYTKDFEHKAPLPLYAAFKLLAAPTCEAKKSLLPFVAEAGGRHALEYLRELDKRKICSLDDFDNCYPCMNMDEELPQTIAKVETRLGT